MINIKNINKKIQLYYIREKKSVAHLVILFDGHGFIGKWVSDQSFGFKDVGP